MKWKPKFFIVFPFKLAEEISWPKGWGNECCGNLAEMLRDELNVATIGSEWKLIWNHQHRMTVLQENEISNLDLDDYLKADCDMLSFSSEGTLKRATKALKQMGSENFICVGSYREMLLQQANYKRTGKFIKEEL